MSFYRLQLKLWFVGFVGLSCLWAGAPAVAQSSVADSETAAAPRSGHDCFDLATEAAEPLGEFRQAVLETAVVVASASDMAEGKAEALSQLAKSYACLGQVDLATELAEETLTAIEAVEAPAVRGRLLTEIAGVYGESLGDVGRMNQLLGEAIALAKATPQDSANQYILLDNIVRLYSRMGDYEKVRETVDIVEDESVREELIQTSLFSMSSDVSDEEQAQILELFPELDPPDSSDLEEDTLTPYQVWMDGFYEFAGEMQLTEDPAALDSLLETQVAGIEALPTAWMQVNGYVELSRHLSLAGYFERSIALAETAAQKATLVDALPGETISDLPELPLNGLLSVAFMLAGDFDRGLTFFVALDDSVEKFPEKLLTLWQISVATPLEEPLQGHLLTLAAEAEQTARLTEPAELYLLDIAAIYLQRDALESAQRLALELLEAHEPSEDEGAEQVFQRRIIELLFSVGSYEEALALFVPSDNLHNFSRRPGILVSEGKDAIAWQVFEKITSPYNQIYVLQDMAQTYQSMDQPDIAFDLVVRALNIAQSDTFDPEAYTVAVYDSFSEQYLASVPTEQRPEMIQNTYEYLFVGMIRSHQDSPEKMRTLVELIDDESLQESVRAQVFFLEDLGITSSEDSDEIEAEAPKDDIYWSRVASDAASGARFQASMEAVSMMLLPVEQVRTLIKIAKCHADSTTTLDAETASLLRQIQQSYQ